MGNSQDGNEDLHIDKIVFLPSLWLIKLVEKKFYVWSPVHGISVASQHRLAPLAISDTSSCLRPAQAHQLGVAVSELVRLLSFSPTRNLRLYRQVR